MSATETVVKPNHWIEIHYALSEENGEFIESSENQEPLRYLHGHNQIIDGLEHALSNRAIGDKFSTVVPAAQAYGEYQDDLLQTVPLDAFEDKENLQEGMQFQAEDQLGPVLVTVKSIVDDQVTLDTNHPFAGKNLKFDVEIISVTEASAEELAPEQ